MAEAFGGWSKVYKRFNAWSASGKWLQMFPTLLADPDMEWVFIDGSYAKARQHSAGAARDQDGAIGKSQVGNTSKIHLAVDVYRSMQFDILGNFASQSKKCRRCEVTTNPQSLKR